MLSWLHVPSIAPSAPGRTLVRRRGRAQHARRQHLHPLRSLPHCLPHLSDPQDRARLAARADLPDARASPRGGSSRASRCSTTWISASTAAPARPCARPGVPYGRMLEATRGQLNRRAEREDAVRRLGEWALKHIFPHRGRMHAVADLLRLGPARPDRRVHAIRLGARDAARLRDPGLRHDACARATE